MGSKVGFLPGFCHQRLIIKSGQLIGRKQPDYVDI